MIIPTFIASKLSVFKGNLEIDSDDNAQVNLVVMLWLGLSAIIFVPIFKMLTHLPPYVGMMLSLGIVAIFAEIYDQNIIQINLMLLVMLVQYTNRLVKLNSLAFYFSAF